MYICLADDPTNAHGRLMNLMRELHEPIFQKSLLQPHSIKLKEFLINLIDQSKFNKNKIKMLNNGNH